MKRSIVNAAQGEQVIDDTFIFHGLGIDLQEYKPSWDHIFQSVV
jgi:hypothetical protein